MEINHAIETVGSSVEYQSDGYSDLKRLEMWTSLLNKINPRTCAEIGIFRGDFARQILANCGSIEQYFMIDPWRHLDNWNKPANVTDEKFREFKREALAVTEF